MPEGLTSDRDVPDPEFKAITASADAELGDYDDEPSITFKVGRVPAPLEEV